MYNISQELSLGLILGVGIGQNFTTKGYGYESQETWLNFWGHINMMELPNNRRWH